KAGKLAKVIDINTLSPSATADVDVGSEPTGVALSPTGAFALVTNFGEGTVSVVDTATMTVSSTIQVGDAPRAISITNNGDDKDTDESAWVTLFFGAPRGPAPETADDGREGRLVEIPLGSLSPGSQV